MAVYISLMRIGIRYPLQMNSGSDSNCQSLFLIWKSITDEIASLLEFNDKVEGK
jgi:hypothetical protein